MNERIFLRSAGFEMDFTWRNRLMDACKRICIGNTSVVLVGGLSFSQAQASFTMPNSVDSTVKNTELATSSSPRRNKVMDCGSRWSTEFLEGAHLPRTGKNDPSGKEEKHTESGRFLQSAESKSPASEP